MPSSYKINPFDLYFTYENGTRNKQEQSKYLKAFNEFTERSDNFFSKWKNKLQPLSTPVDIDGNKTVVFDDLEDTKVHSFKFGDNEASFVITRYNNETEQEEQFTFNFSGVSNLKIKSQEMGKDGTFDIEVLPEHLNDVFLDYDEKVKGIFFTESPEGVTEINLMLVELVYQDIYIDSSEVWVKAMGLEDERGALEYVNLLRIRFGFEDASFKAEVI